MLFIFVRYFVVSSASKTSYSWTHGILSPCFTPCRVRPNDYIFPFDLRGVKSREEVFEITGRPWMLETPVESYLDGEELREIEVRTYMERSFLTCKDKGLQKGVALPCASIDELHGRTSGILKWAAAGNISQVHASLYAQQCPNS